MPTDAPSPPPPSFWRAWRADAWHHARSQFSWFHPTMAVVAGVFIQWTIGDRVAALESLETSVWAGLGVVVWAVVVLVGNFVASVPRLYGRQLAENQALRQQLRQATDEVSAWRAIEERFAAIEHEVAVTWSYNTVTGDVHWWLNVESAGRASLAERFGSAGVVRDRTVARFEAEATAAAALLRKMANPPAFIAAPSGGQSPVDQWLNALAALIDRSRELAGTGRSDGQRTLGGAISSVVHASQLACARLATGDVPALRRERAAELAEMVTKYEALIRDAQVSGFVEPARASLDGHAERVADALSMWLGPADRAVFMSAAPNSQVCAGLPSAHAAYWQRHVGRLHHLRAVVAEWNR